MPEDRWMHGKAAASLVVDLRGERERGQAPAGPGRRKETSLTGHWVSESGLVGGPGQEFLNQTVGDCLLR